MEICNNRYRIIKEIKSDNNAIQNFIAEDLWNPQNPNLDLKIINMENIDENIISFLKNNFFIIKNQNSGLYFKSYEFTRLLNVDGNDIEEYSCIYTSEYKEDSTNLIKFLQKASFIESLEIIISVCKILNFAVNYKVVYKDLNLRNLKIKRENDSIKIKAIDIISSLLLQPGHVLELETQQLKDFEYENNILQDAFISILAKKELKNTSDEGIQKIENKYQKVKLIDKERKILNCLLDICKKLSSDKAKGRKYPIIKIVEDINNQLDKSFSIFRTENMETSIIKPQVTSKNSEKSKIFSHFYDLQAGKETSNVFFISSQLGTGKTSFLEEMNFLFSIEKCTVYDIPSLGEFDDEKFIIHIIRNFILNNGKTNKSYEKEILEAVEFIKKEKNNKDLIYKVSMLKYKLANRIANLILERIHTEFVVFIVDDIHLASDFIIDVFLYLATERTSKKNFILLFSYDKLTIKNNTQAKKFINILNSQNNIVKLDLKNLDKQETYVLISCILGTKNIPETFIDKIYNHTNGNPLFIQEIIKELINNNEISSDKKTQNLKFSDNILDNNSTIQVSSSIENSLKNHLKKLNPKDIEILNAISIFKNSFTKKIFFELLDLNDKSIENSLRYLLKNNIIKEIKTGKNIKYALENRIIQKIIYNEFDNSYKMKMHKKIVEIIKNTSSFNINELIWHSERAGLKESVTEYCLKNKETIKKLYSSETFISIFKKILDFIDDKDSNNNLEVLLLIAKSQLELSEISACEKSLKQAEKCINNKNIRKDLIASFYIIKTLQELQTNMSIKEIKKTLSKAEKATSNSDDILIELQFFNAKTLYLQEDKKFKQALTLSQKVISISANNKILQEEKAMAILNSGRTYFYIEEFEKAEKKFLEAIALTKKIKNIGIRDTANNNLAVIYTNLKHDYEASLKYYNEIIQNNEGFTTSSIQILAIINSARVNIYMGEFDKAYEYALSSIKKLAKTPLPNRMLFAYTNLYEILFILRKFKMAETYQLKIKKLFNNKKVIQKPVYQISYQNTLANIFGFLGDYTNEKANIEKALSLTNSNIRKCLLNILLETNSLVTGDTTDSKNLISHYKKLITNKNLSRDIHFSYYALLASTRRLLVLCPDIEINYILKFLTNFDMTVMSNHMKASKLFLLAFFDTKNKEKHLTNALELIKTSSVLDLKIDIHTQLALYYLSEANTNMAIVKFIDAQNIIIELMKQIPNKNKLTCFNENKYACPFKAVSDFLEGKMKKDYLYFNEKFTSKEMKKFLNSDMISKLKNNKAFMSEIVRQTINNSVVKNKSMESIINNFSDNFMQNLKMISNFLGLNLLAAYYDIIVKDLEGDMVSIFNYTKKYDDTKNDIELMKKVATIKTPTCFTTKDDNRVSLIFPINYYDEISMKTRISAFLIFSSYRNLNNFGKFGIDLCKQLEPLFAFIIESYKLQQEASIDKLTKTLSRKYLDIAFKDLIVKSKIKNESFSVLMYDLDKFKNVNDTFGHQIGDVVLSETAKAVKKNLNDDQIIGRYGGEEFIVLLPNMPKKETFLFAEKIRKEIEELKFDQDELKITISIGISFFPSNGDNMQDLFLKADHALYNAKNSGRNQVFVWNENLKIITKEEDSLTGVISGDFIEDQQKIRALIDSISMVKTTLTKAQKIKFCIEKITELSGADSGIFIPIKKNEKIGQILKKSNIKHSSISFNQNFIKTAIKSQKGLYKIDWDNIASIDEITKIPTWNSVIIQPVIKAKEVKGLVYLTVAIRKKEFSIKEFNLVNILVKTLAPYL